MWDTKALRQESHVALHGGTTYKSVGPGNMARYGHSSLQFWGLGHKIHRWCEWGREPEGTRAFGHLPALTRPWPPFQTLPES